MMPIPTDHATTEPVDSLRLHRPHHPTALGITTLEALRDAYLGAYVDICRPPAPAEIESGADPEQPWGASGLVEDVTLADGVPGVITDYGYGFEITPDALVRACREDHPHSHPLPLRCPLSEPGPSRPAPRPLPDALRPVTAQVLSNLTAGGCLLLSPERASELADFFDWLAHPRHPVTLDQIAARADEVRDALGIGGEV